MKFLERHTLSIHLAVIVAGFLTFALALMSGEWRWLLVTAAACWFTVKT